MTDLGKYGIKVIEPGTKYEMDNGLLFIFEKQTSSGFWIPGIRSEQMLAVLIHRLTHFQEVEPSDENGLCLQHLVVALHLLEAREASREAFKATKNIEDNIYHTGMPVKDQ